MRISASLSLSALLAFISSTAISQVVGTCGNQLDLPQNSCIATADPRRNCLWVIQNEPRRLTATLALCDLALAERDYDEAKSLLDDATLVHRTDNYALNLIRIARSNVAEARSANSVRRGDIDVLAEYLVIRCEELKNLDACAELMGLRPDFPLPNNVLGTAALNDGEVVWAIKYFKRSLALDSAQTNIAENLEQAQALRQEVVEQCFELAGRRAIEACQAARIPGADDEAEILVRLGDLNIGQQEMERAMTLFREALEFDQKDLASRRMALLTWVEECASENSSSLQACERAIAETPKNELFRSIRNSAFMQRCLLMLDTTTSAEAKAACDEAKRANPETAVELDSRLASKALRECEDLINRGDTSSAISTCELAQNLATEPGVTTRSSDLANRLQPQAFGVNGDAIDLAGKKPNSQDRTAPFATDLSNNPLSEEPGVAIVTY